MIGASAMALVPPEFEPEVSAYVEDALAGKRVGTVQVDLLHKSGERVAVELSAAPLMYESQQATLVVARDIRARRRAEDELAQLQSRFQHTQKLESLGVLAGGIAHDFNNLLSAVLGNASLAKLHLPADSNAAKNLAAIEKAAQQAADLTGQMLAYSGRGHFTAEPVDITLLVDEMLDLLASVISKKATLETHFGEDLPAAVGDISQLRQVVMNLILNASEALEDRAGRILLTTGVCRLDRGALANSYLDDGLPPGRYVFLDVTDTGRGMDNATLAKVFDPFFSTKATGRGLGLAATLGIIRAHRGAVTVRSAPGQGTAFRVHLPAASTVSTRPSAPEPTRPSVGDATVLVVDDEPMVREVTGAMLEELGYDCQLAESGASALRQLEADPEGIDVVVLDLTMPDLSGTEVLELYATHPTRAAGRAVQRLQRDGPERPCRCGECQRFSAEAVHHVGAGSKDPRGPRSLVRRRVRGLAASARGTPSAAAAAAPARRTAGPAAAGVRAGVHRASATGRARGSSRVAAAAAAAATRAAAAAAGSPRASTAVARASAIRHEAIGTQLAVLANRIHDLASVAVLAQEAQTALNAPRSCHTRRSRARHFRSHPGQDRR